ncbi:MAG: hypothetical protein U0793_24730 [Gemmataceae bacterium]
MRKRQARRIYGELTPAQKRRLTIARKKVAEELPELLRRHQMMINARKEKTLSGELRRAMHESKWDLWEIAKKIEIPPADLTDFLTGESTLSSDTIDRLVKLLGYKLNPSHPRKKTG